jgi:hypothetical protein
MGLSGNNISTWEEMKKEFLDKYQYYCKNRDCKDEIFRFSWKEDEILENYVHQFKYTSKNQGKASYMKKPGEVCC